jgi:hypothetical protein
MEWNEGTISKSFARGTAKKQEKGFGWLREAVGRRQLLTVRGGEVRR